jgi:hypothetical protein
MTTSSTTPDSSTEVLYDEVTDNAALVRRVGLREALGVLDPHLRDRKNASAAVRELNVLAEQHRRNYSNGSELNHADFLRGETRDAAYELDLQLA